MGLEWSEDRREIKFKTGKGLTHRPVSILAVMDVGSKALHTPLGPILPKVTCNELQDGNKIRKSTQKSERWGG